MVGAISRLKCSSGRSKCGLQTSSVPTTPMGKPSVRRLDQLPALMFGRSRPVRYKMIAPASWAARAKAAAPGTSESWAR